MKRPWLAAGALLAGFVFVFVRFRLHLHWVYAWLIAVNAVTFLLFGADKLMAVIQGRRVRESTLHLFAFLGGSPAALAAQSLFRHKVSKRKFVLAYWGIVLAQGALVYIVMYTDLLKETIL